MSFQHVLLLPCSLDHKALHFFFPIYLNTFFLLCTTFSAWNSCDQTGNYISEQTQASPCRQGQPDSSTEPNPKALCLKPKPHVQQEIWVFFLSLVQSQLESEKEKPTYLPPRPMSDTLQSLDMCPRFLLLFACM